MLRLMRRLRECLPLFAAATVVTALAQIALVAVTITSVWITTRFLTNSDALTSGIIALLFGFVASHGVATLLEVWWSHEVAYRILHTFRRHIYAAIRRIAPLGLQGRRTGDVASAAMDDAEKLEWFYAHTASTAICAVVNPSIFIAGLCYLIGPLGLIMFLPAITMVALPLLLLPIQQRQGYALREALVELRIAVLNAVQGQRELISLGMVVQQQDIIDQLTRDVQRIINKQSMRKAWETAYTAISTSICTVALLIVLTGWVLDGKLSSSVLPIAVVLAGMSMNPTISLVGMLGRIGEIGACAKRINQILDAEDPIPHEPQDCARDELGKRVRDELGRDELGKRVRDERSGREQGEREQREREQGERERGVLVADTVSFSYGEQPVLHELSLKVEPSRSVAIVGASGAGKTTFANLVMRFLDPNAGSLSFDGKDLRQYVPDEYRQHLALIPQDCHIFAGTIRTNLALAKPEATDSQMWEALESAQISTLVQSLGGLDAAIGDRGTTLSGGERQRIGIARAILREPQLLLLDEPLANIDPFLEANIAARLRETRSNRSTIVIAHRLASIKIADHIVVIDQGKIIAQGTHRELVENAHYRTLLGDQLLSEQIVGES
nr:ABC transporter ATP-binding protein [Arcanobacterium pluranimalium]